MRLLKASPYSIFFVTCFTTCSAIQLPNTTLIEEAPLKMRLVDEIVKKICNLSLDTFANKNPVEKAKLIVMMEEKLNKSAQALGDHGYKYVKLIMKGIKAKAFNLYATEGLPQIASHDNNLLNKTKTLSLRTATANVSKSEKRTVHKQKGTLVHAIANKINILAKSYLDLAKTPEERKLAIEKVKKLLIDSASHTDAIKKEELNKYVDLVARGVEIMMGKGTRTGDQRKHMDVDIANTIGKENILDPLEFDMPHDKKLGIETSLNNELNLNLFSPTKITVLPKNLLCNDSLHETCRKIKSVKTRKCSSVNGEFNIIKLCDAQHDCADFSDEKECVLQAIEIVLATERLIGQIDTSLSQKCYPDLADRSLLGKQNRVLSEVLKLQLKHLKMTSVETSATESKVYAAKSEANKVSVHEIMNVVDSLTSALGASMCRNFDKDSRPQNNYLEEQRFEEKIQNLKANAAPEVCKCKGKGCVKTCTEKCAEICAEMYALSQLTCQAVSGEESVSLDLMCDGKLDCYDESDEKDCLIDASLAKFEATNMYTYILKDIEAKLFKLTQHQIRSKLLNLHAIVTKYQKLSLTRNTDIAVVKRLRDAMFKELMAVYDSAVQHLKNAEDFFELRFSLVTLKERLISAVKRSNTGNERIMSADGCVCQGYKCALPQCSKACVRACSVEPQLTRFFCGSLTDPLNNSLPIELLCNGRSNCPNGEDEIGCNIGACRSLHLKLLGQKLQDCGRRHDGTGLGEALRTWRIKALATLAIAEEGSRPTPPILHEILRGLLHDLVMAYTTLEDRRDNDAIFKEFYKWSRVVMDTLKLCNA